MFISPLQVCDSKCEVSSVNRSGDPKSTVSIVSIGIQSFVNPFNEVNGMK